MKRHQRLVIMSVLLASAACASAPDPAPEAAGADQPHDMPATDEHAGRHEPGAMEHLSATAGPGYAVADVKFMQHMIGHHEQALTMVAMAAGRGASDHFMRLAQKIDISQKDEIALMERWLTDRGQPVPPDGYMDHMTMPGMATPEQLAQLEAARGREFERIFLTLMIRHHEGALQMVEELFDAPAAGQDPDIFRFATDVDADQRDEIYTMQTMLDILESTRGSSDL